MAQYDGYVRISTQNDTSDAIKSTEQLGDKIAEAMDTAPVEKMSESLKDVEDTLKTTGETAKKTSKETEEGFEGIGDTALKTSDIIKANLISDVVLKGIQQLGAGLKDAAVHTVDIADGLDSSAKRIAAATNATEAELQSLEAVINQVYRDNFGSGYDDIADSISAIKRNIGELDDASLVNVTESALALRDVFGYSVEESSRAAKAIEKNFNVSAAVAYDYIARGAQNGLDFSGEMLDTISEYSVQFKKLGFDIDEVFNIMQAGAENGAWKLDTVGDIIKELSITAIDGADSTREGFELLGLNADEMAKKFATGGESAKHAFEETIAALAAMNDPIKQDAAGVALMKTMWEDLGKEAVLALGNIADSAYEASGAMEGIKELNYSSLDDSIGSMKRQIDMLIQPIGEALIPSIEDVTDAVSEAAEAGDVTDIAKGIGEFASGTLTFLLKNIKLIGSGLAGATAGVVAFKTASVITKVISSWQAAAVSVTKFTAKQGAAALATKALNGKLTQQQIIYATLSGKLDTATAKTALFNTTLKANPAGAIAAAIGLLVTGLTLFNLGASESANKTKELIDAANDLKESTEAAIIDGEAEVVMLEKKAQRYDELRSSMNRTQAEQAELESLAKELQDTLGDEVSVINALTGEYNDLSGAIDTYAQKMRQQIKLEAMKDSALEAQKLILENEKQINELDNKIIELQGRSDFEVLLTAYGIGENSNSLVAQKTLLEQTNKELQNTIDAYFDEVSTEYELDIKLNTSATTSGLSATALEAQYKGLADQKAYEEYKKKVEAQYEENEKLYKQQRANAKYQYDMGEIDAAEYYAKLAVLRDKYLKTDSDEWRDANVEIKKYYDDLSAEQQKAYEEQTLAEQKAYEEKLARRQKIAEESKRARLEAYDEERADLQFRLKTQKITEEQYYKELSKIRDKYLDKNSEEWRSAYLETYQYNQQIIADNKDTLAQMLSDASDTTLSALENITAARDSLTAKLTDFNKTFEKITETVPETIAVKGDFTITTAEHEVEVYRMGADSIEDNIKVLEEYGAMLDALKARGADDDTLNDILAMDVDEAMEFGSQMLSMSDKEWNGYFDSMAKLRQTAADISAKYYQSEVESLKENFVDKMRSELEGLGADMHLVGADVAAEFVAGWNEALGTKDLTIGQLMHSISGTVDTAPAAAQQSIATGGTAATKAEAASTGVKVVEVPVYIGTNKIADIMIDAINGKTVQTGKNVLKT